MNNNKTDGIPDEDREPFNDYMASTPMATYWSTWLAGRAYQRNNDLSPAYLALTHENDRLRRLLTDRGIEHQGKPLEYQYRQRPIWRKQDKSAWMPWRPCAEDIARHFIANPEDAQWQYETRGLFPYSAAPVVYPSIDDIMKVVLNYQVNERTNVTGTTNWAANIGMVVIDRVRELNK